MKEVNIISKVVGRSGAEASPSSAIIPNMSGYATKTELNTLRDEFKDFLEGADADVIINKWQELVSFLEGISEEFDLLSMLGLKADKSELSNYVTIATEQTISAHKNFLNGLSVGGLGITKSQDDVIYLDANLVVRGGITMFGTNSVDVPTIMDAIATDGVNIQVVNGVLTFVGKTGGGVADSVLWDNVEGKPSWIGSSKPSYSYSEISGTPTLLSSFTDDVVAGKYLPLSGGKLSTKSNIVLTLDASTMGDQNYLQFYNVRYSLGCLGFSAKDNPVYRTSSGTNYKLWHSGNFTPSDYLLASNYTASDILTKLLTVDGSGSGLDADLLDGLQPSELYVAGISEVYNKNVNFKVGHQKLQIISSTLADAVDNGFPFRYSSGLSVISDYVGWQMVVPGGSAYKNPYFRKLNDYGTWSDWEQLAFLTDNVASASKLETPRTIWGQSFDGSGDVSGTLTLGYNSIIGGGDEPILGQSTGGYILLGLGTSKKGFDTYIDGYNTRFRYGTASTEGMRLTSSGNVLIGTTEDSGYKLDVVKNKADNIFKVSGPANTFRITSSGTGAYNHTNGGWAIYAGSASSESARFEVIDKNGSWTGKGWTLFKNGNMSIGTITDSGYKLDVNGDIRAKKKVKILSGDDAYDGAMYISNGNLAIESSQIGVKLNDILLNPNGGKSQGHVTINGIPIYKSQDDVLYIDGNLAVRGGITMYATDAIDVPSIIDALPIASASAKGIAAFNPNDFSIVDGYVSFIGKGGVDESVLADYAKKTDLSGYLPLSGGRRITGDIGFNLSRADTFGIGVAAAGSETYDDWGTFVSESKSFMGSLMSNKYGDWWNIISARHYNGFGSDGSRYGMYLTSNMTAHSANLMWNRQYAGNWQGERVILDSVNWKDYVTTGNGGISGNVLTVDGSDYRGGYPALRMHIPNVNWHQFLMRGDGIVELRYGDGGQSGGWGQLALGTIFFDDQRDDVLYFPGKEYFDNHGNMHIPNADGSWSWNIYNSNGSTVMTIYTNGNILSAGGITMYSDIRKKTKLQDVELTLQQIADAPLIEHYYNSDAMRTTHVGSIAQYWASMNDWFCKLDNDGYYTMEIQNAALASAISIARELVKYESKTDRKIRLLKQRVKELEDKIEKLENN